MNRSAIRGLVPCTIAGGVGAGLRIATGSATRDYCLGTNEVPVQEALRSIVQPGAVVYDIGANIGFFTILAARLVGPSGTVVAFEPVPQNARLTRWNARINRFRNVVVRREAVARSAGEAELILTHHIGGGTLVSAGTPPDATGRARVRTASLDSLVASGEIPRPTVVKIDVEGAELEVLEGMSEVLSNDRPVLILEFDDESEQKVEEKIARCSDLLGAAYYELRNLPDSYAGNWVVRHIVATPATDRYLAKAV